MRACGKRFATEDQARHSKKYLAGGYEVWPCRYGCGGFHLADLAKLDAEIEKALAAARRNAAAKDTGPDAVTRATVYERDGWACVCCGTPVKGRPRSVGHRKRRSQGGGHGLTNLLTFLGLGTDAGNPDDHHARIDSRKDSHDGARGYRCESWENPAEIPVMFHGQDGGFTAWLLSDGGLSFDGPEVLTA